jgi:hypothetical protein
MSMNAAHKQQQTAVVYARVSSRSRSRAIQPKSRRTGRVFWNPRFSGLRKADLPRSIPFGGAMILAGHPVVIFASQCTRFYRAYGLAPPHRETLTLNLWSKRILGCLSARLTKLI